MPSGRWREWRRSSDARPDGMDGMTEHHRSRPARRSAIRASADHVELQRERRRCRTSAPNCLSDGPVGRVGLEIEAHCFDLADPMRRPGWDELTEVIAAVPALPGGSAITVEPGGAVELSGPPCDGVAAAIAAMAADRAVLRQAFAQRRVGPGAARRRPAAARPSASTRAPVTARWSSSSRPATPVRPARR